MKRGREREGAGGGRGGCVPELEARDALSTRHDHCSLVGFVPAVGVEITDAVRYEHTYNASYLTESVRVF